MKAPARLGLDLLALLLALLLVMGLALGLALHRPDALPWLGGALLGLALTALLLRLHRAESQAERLVQRLDTTLDQASIGIGRVALDGRWLSMNERLAEILGHSAEALRRRGFLDLLPPDQLRADQALARQLVHGEIASVRLQRRYLRADGSTVWALVSARLVRNEQGLPDSLAVVLEDISDLKNAEAALQTSEAGLRQLVQAIPDMVWCKDAEGRYTRCNTEALQLFGRQEAEMIGRTDEELFGPERGRRYREEDRRVMRSGTLLRLKEWQLAPDGREVLLEITKTPLHQHDGPLDGVLCVAQDITPRQHTTERLEAAEARTRELLAEAERSRRALLSVIEDQQQAQASLRTSEARLRMTLEGSATGLWDWDLVSDYVTYSDTYQQLLHHPVGQSRFHADFSFRARLHPEDRERVIAAVHRTIDEAVPFNEDYRLLCFDEQWRWFHGRGYCLRDEQQQPVRFSGILSDLSERHHAEERQRLAAAVIDNTQEGVLVTDAQRRIVSINRAFSTLLGYSEAEVIGRTPALLQSGRQDRNFYRTMWQAVQSSGHWQGEIWNRRKDGSVFPELLSISVVRDRNEQITHYIGIFTDISKLKASEAELEFLAHHDALTRLPNRVMFMKRLEQLLDDSPPRAAVLMLDLDRFKDVNDSYGHFAGDELLRLVARRLGERLPAHATLARLGGDEFAILLPDLMLQEEAAHLARGIIAALSEPWQLDNGAEVVIGASVGICLYPDHGDTPQALLQGADAALYHAKADGRGLHRYYSDALTAAALARLQMEARLRRALQEQQLQLHYQPQYDIGSGRLIGTEALLRWHDPDSGWIAPDRFIPIAEATGLIGDLGEWVLQQACAQGRRWLDAGLPALTLAVNVSPQQFRHGDLAERVMRILLDTRYPSQLLELELTESALMQRETQVYATLQGLRGLGIGLAIDDFGTGYSSLAYLKRFAVDVLKIDRSFITDIPRDHDDMEIASAVIAMGHSLGLKVLAEGVETEAQLDFLRQKGCDRFQGYLRHRPLPVEAMTALLQAQPPAALPPPPSVQHEQRQLGA